MKWKVCGMRDANNISEVAALQPDYMGFILWSGSTRHCPKTQHVPNGITKVGVFVDAAIEEINDAIEHHKLGAVQLHGKESPCCAVSYKVKYKSSRHLELVKILTLIRF